MKAEKEDLQLSHQRSKPALIIWENEALYLTVETLSTNVLMLQRLQFLTATILDGNWTSLFVGVQDFYLR